MREAHIDRYWLMLSCVIGSKAPSSNNIYAVCRLYHMMGVNESLNFKVISWNLMCFQMTIITKTINMFILNLYAYYFFMGEMISVVEGIKKTELIISIYIYRPNDPIIVKCNIFGSANTHYVESVAVNKYFKIGQILSNYVVIHLCSKHQSMSISLINQRSGPSPQHCYFMLNEFYMKMHIFSSSTDLYPCRCVILLLYPISTILVIVIFDMLTANINNKSDFLLYTPVGFPSHAISDLILYW